MFVCLEGPVAFLLQPTFDMPEKNPLGEVNQQGALPTMKRLLPKVRLASSMPLVVTRQLDLYA